MPAKPNAVVPPPTMRTRSPGSRPGWRLPPDRRAVLEQRLRATREEEARRLAEIAEKYEARHTIRPYRLHAMLVPALRVPADVLRGMRRYPMYFDWLLPPGPTRLRAARPAVARHRWWPANSSSAAKRASLRSRSPRRDRLDPCRRRPVRHGVPGPRQRPRRCHRRRNGQPSSRRRCARSSRRPPLRWPNGCGARSPPMTAARSVGFFTRVRPAASLDRLLGPAGLCRVLGMPLAEDPERFLAETDGDVITGALLGARGTECPYHIYCRDGQAAEVLPFPVVADGAFWGFYWWGQRPGGRWAVGGIVPATGLDPVEGELAVTGSAWNGLPVAARALASWGRIAAHQERLLSAHAAQSLAAAVNRLVACRARAGDLRHGGSPIPRAGAGCEAGRPCCARAPSPRPGSALVAERVRPDDEKRRENRTAPQGTRPRWATERQDRMVPHWGIRSRSSALGSSIPSFAHWLTKSAARSAE